jgi:transposase-like protein
MMHKSSRLRKHSTPAQREKILQSYQRSQLSQKEFAAQAGISVATLALWRGQASVRKEGEAAFVAVPNLLSAAPAFRLQWPGGLSLEIRSGFSPGELAAVLQLFPAR